MRVAALFTGALLLVTGLATAQTARPLSASDEAFLRDLEGQRKGLQGKPATALPTAPPARGPATAKPEPKPSIDADLARIAESEGEALAPLEGSEPKVPTKTVVFISLSMPERDLKALFAQGRGRPDVLFVVRGWKPPSFATVAQQLKRAMLDAGGLDINVVIDPYPFRIYKVRQVPVFLHERSGGDWRRVTGAISLDRAIDEIERGNYNRTLGPTFRVDEPDIIDEIQKRADSFDWEAEKAKLAQKAMTNMDGGKPLVSLPRVEVTREFFVDPSITVTEDVHGSDGAVAVTKGSSLNPFSVMGFTKSFVAFDPDDPKQVALARRWSQERGPVLLMATHLPPPKRGQPSLAARMGQSVYPLSPQIVERMGIAAVPSFIQQQGLLLRIVEEKP